jgi:thiol-disulfide isomerase/thioredoxin
LAVDFPNKKVLHSGSPKGVCSRADTKVRPSWWGAAGALALLLLFIEPECGPCDELLPDVKAWERKVSGDAAKLLVVSAGTVKDNRAQGFLSPVVLDRDFDAGHAFGAQGTPSAVVVDANGIIASEVSVGGEQVLQLMTRCMIDD